VHEIVKKKELATGREKFTQNFRNLSRNTVEESQGLRGGGAKNGSQEVRTMEFKEGCDEIRCHGRYSNESGGSRECRTQNLRGRGPVLRKLGARITRANCESWKGHACEN